MVEQLQSMLSNLKAEFIEPVMVKGAPKEADYIALDELADKISALVSNPEQESNDED